MDIDWQSLDSHLLLNSKLPESQTDGLSLSCLPDLPGHVWLASSGTTSSSLTLFALSKPALLASAQAVNQHLRVTVKDVWLNVLPQFHVGGLAIYARAFLTGSKIVNKDFAVWSAENFIQSVRVNQATLTSLVPTQVYDLVQARKMCPPSLRAIVVGGAKLSDELYLAARDLKFPVLPSYGMTECSSQIATAELESLSMTTAPSLKPLRHVSVKIVNDHLAIKSASLFTVKANWQDQKAELTWQTDEWYVTQDRAELQLGNIVPLGRSSDQVKISGELVSLQYLNSIFVSIVGEGRGVIFAHADARRGTEIAAAFALNDYWQATEWVRAYNKNTISLARIKNYYFVEELPKTELGKIKPMTLKSQLGF